MFFITGNTNKFAEVKAILGDVEQLDIDLPEIQEIDPYKIISVKLQAARAHHDGLFLLEDVSLQLECLNGLPGPLIKWFLKTTGISGLANIAEKLGNNKATAKVIYGYAESKTKFQFFEGEVHGTIVAPRGKAGFGFDPILQPDGFSKTFAEMTQDEKNEISMRRIALNKLKEFLSQQ